VIFRRFPETKILGYGAFRCADDTLRIENSWLTDKTLKAALEIKAVLEIKIRIPVWKLLHRPIRPTDRSPPGAEFSCRSLSALYEEDMRYAHDHTNNLEHRATYKQREENLNSPDSLLFLNCDPPFQFILI